MGAELVIASSAFRHGVSDKDIRHAFTHPVRVFELEEGFVMLIGASTSGALLEIGVVEAETGSVVVHAMPCREKFLG